MTTAAALLKRSVAGFGRRQSLLSSSGLTMAASVWSTAIAMVTVPIMVHGLGFESYGLYSVAFSVAALGSYLDFGLGWTTAKFVAEADSETSLKNAATAMAASAVHQLAFGLVFAVVVIAAASPITVLVLRVPDEHAASAAIVLRLTAASFLVSSVLGVFVSTLRGLRRFSAATLIATGATTLSALGPAAAVSMGLGIVGAASAQLFGVTCGALAGLAACQSLVMSADYRGGLLQQWRAMLSFSIWNYASKLLQMLVLQMDKIAIVHWGGPAVLTFYSVPFNFAQRVNVLAGPAVTAIYPIAVVGRTDRAAFMRQYLAAARLLHLTTAALACALLVWGDRFLGAWVGPDMAQRGAFFLWPLTVGFWALSVGSFDGGCIEGWNKPRTIFMLSAIGTLLGIVVGGAAFSLLQDSTKAVALAVSAYFVAVGVGQMIVWYRMSQYPLRFMLARVALPIVEVGALAAAAAFVLRRIVDGRAATIVVLFGLMAGLGAYGIVRTMSRDELRVLTRRMLAPFGAA